MEVTQNACKFVERRIFSVEAASLSVQRQAISAGKKVRSAPRLARAQIAPSGRRRVGAHRYPFHWNCYPAPQGLGERSLLETAQARRHVRPEGESAALTPTERAGIRRGGELGG